MKAQKKLSITVWLISSLILFKANISIGQSLLTPVSPIPSFSKLVADTTTSLMYSQDSYRKYYDSSLGFICRAEKIFDAKSKLKLRMRLGNLDYVNRLEMKVPNYRQP